MGGSVSLQDIEAAVGDVVILPCSPNKALQVKVTVYWRFRDTNTVYDIIDGRAADYQDESFRGRVDSFPAEWTKGNFSIKLHDLTKADGGMYTCFVPAVYTRSSVYLSVKDSPLPMGPGGSSQDLRKLGSPGPTTEPPVLGNRGDKRRPENVLLFSAALLGLTLT
ncbi:hypothetical protein MHYP_G00301410 [Metynnis hypsauchen]